MNTFRLHYAKIDLEDDIPFFEFKEDESGIIYTDKVVEFIDKIYPNEFLPEDIVFLIALGDNIFISDDFLNIVACAKSFFNDFRTTSDECDIDNMYIHEYPSFEEAYTVAFMMKEENPLCYSSETKDSPYWNLAGRAL